MSGTLPVLQADFPLDNSRRIWIRETDPTGLPVDPAFIAAAYRKEKAFFHLRRREFPDDARVASLIEEAVYRASRAVRSEPVSDPAGYLYRVYVNLLNQEIAKEVPTVVRENAALELLASVAANKPNVTEKIFWRELLDAMDLETRSVWEQRMVGFKIQEIARKINVSPDCLSTRIRRGTKEALKRLFGGDVR